MVIWLWCRRSKNRFSLTYLIGCIHLSGTYTFYRHIYGSVVHRTQYKMADSLVAVARILVILEYTRNYCIIMFGACLSHF